MLAASLLCSSCADKEARAYAHKLAELLDKYSAQIDAKLNDEQARYVREAKGNEEDAEVDEADRLDLLRSNGAKEAARVLKAGKTNAAAAVDRMVATYARVDFESTRELYAKSQDAYMAHLKGLADLSLEKAKITALKQALKELAKDPGVFAQAEAAAKFGSDLQGMVNANTCKAAQASKARAEGDAKKLAGSVPKDDDEKKLIDAKVASAKADAASASKLVAAACK